MIEFEKFHGTGNDFIIINGLTQNFYKYSSLAKSICDRNYGVGADGMLIVESSNKAEIKMIFYNADGSEAPMCGNGLRCFSKFIYDNEIIRDKKFTVETLGGVMEVEIKLIHNTLKHVKINLGNPKINFINKEVEIDNIIYKISTLFIGTIHTVIKVENLEKIPLEDIGNKIENLNIFPKKTNVNFYEVIDENNLKVITWERGVGKTLSCGTGAAATAIISSILNNTNTKVNIHMIGGELEVEVIDNSVYLTGPVDFICKGYFNY
ncbi:diaminopimelate epimerase [Senegalia massiliensis]|uniref:Diaminopimelate epimerase n=1 Tax=Senegalia massiliensis TaxID=1720316 RepID=A0A845R633_9CLOT|nr:diaminopimelate epimerase [Senegalia massiliensis]NBI07963.1 diaminopimelate epimerase [Senegalia massiliensis]